MGFVRHFVIAFICVFGFALVQSQSMGVGAVTISVLATVNGQPITSHDLAERRNMLIKTTGLRLTEDNRDQIDRDVLQMLIDDAIKIAEGERLFADRLEAVNRSADELIDRTLSQNGQDPDEVLAELEIPRHVMHSKFKADVLWASTIRSRFNSQFANAQSEAEAELEQMTEDIDKPHIRLSEIVLAPEPSRDVGATLALAEEIATTVRQGADFGRIAQQYSISGSAPNGGDLGWQPTDRIANETLAVTQSLGTGDVADPIDRDGTIYIYRVTGKRDRGYADPTEAVVSLARVLMPVEGNDDADRLEAAARVSRDTSSISSCEELLALHDQYASGLPFSLGAAPLYELSAPLRTLITPLEAGEISRPMNFTEGVAAFMVCEKTAPNADLPSLDELTLATQNNYFSVLSARYLNQLRRNAVIEIRDTRIQ
ncbi:MAG: peptidylprolyl isomerase [Proteobacteria bacterium]|nr:peptidylprolyl isomerase [Pseudomonadota bacterium]